MIDTELVKMSPKGQLVVPRAIRKKGGFDSGDRFISFPIKDGVLFKKIDTIDAEAEFQKLSEEISKEFKKKKIAPKDVEEAIKWARRG